MADEYIFDLISIWDVLSYLPELHKSSREEVIAQTQEHGDPRGIQILLSDLQRHPELFVTFTAALYITNPAAFKEIDRRTWLACCGKERKYQQFVDTLNDKLKELGHFNDGDGLPANQHIQQLPLRVENPNMGATNQVPAACLPIIQRELPPANQQPPNLTRPVCAVSSLENLVNPMPGYGEMFNIHEVAIGDLRAPVYARLGNELNKPDPNSIDERPYWDEILSDPNSQLKITAKEHRKLENERNPGKTLLNLMDDYRHSLADLLRVFTERRMLDSLQVLETEYKGVAAAVRELPVTRPTDTSMAYLNENNLNTALERSASSSVLANKSSQNISAVASAPDLQSLQTVTSRRLTEPPVTRPDAPYTYLNENNLNTALDQSASSSVSDNESYQNIPAGALAPELQSLQTAGRKLDVDQIVSQNGMSLHYSRNPETQQAIDDIFAATDKPIARANIIQRTSTARINGTGTRPVTGSHLGMLGANNLNSSQQQRFYNQPGSRSQGEEATNQKPENLTALQAQLNTGLLLALNMGFNPMALQNWLTVQNMYGRNGMSTMPVFPPGMSSMPGMSQGQGQSFGDNSGEVPGLLPIFQHLVQRRDQPRANQPDNKQH